LKYGYTEKDLLDHPQKYQHSIFEGKSFISGYLNSRKNINKKIQNNATIISVSDTLDLLSIPYTETSIRKNDGFFTEEFLIDFLQDNKIKENKIQIIEKLLKIFEIKKKIYSTYDFRIDKHSNDFSSLRNYILFSIICNKIFQMNKNLKFFNTTLKVNDIICSKINSISDVNDLSLTYNAIKFELQQFEKLLEKNLVKI
jgi:hypothetical protein|tara:strand:- start:251 stop:847 length:597 start_codon:yes stop_codon:yes gene_type:complete